MKYLILFIVAVCVSACVVEPYGGRGYYGYGGYYGGYHGGYYGGRGYNYGHFERR